MPDKTPNTTALNSENSNNYSFKRTLLSAIAAFIGYGTWSAYANFDHGMDMVSKIVLIYGSYSAVATLVYSNVMEYFFHRISPRQTASIITILLTCTLMYATTSAVNIAIVTPELLLTIVPGIVLSTFFAVGYVKVLKVKSLSQSA